MKKIILILFAFTVLLSFSFGESSITLKELKGPFKEKAIVYNSTGKGFQEVEKKSPVDISFYDKKGNLLNTITLPPEERIYEEKFPAKTFKIELSEDFTFVRKGTIGYAESRLKAIQEEEALAKAKEKEKEEKEKAEKIAKENAKAMELAKGYIYHGPEEAKSSGNLFNAGALEEGHAYYLTGFLIHKSGDMGCVVLSIFSNPSYKLINYASQKIRGEVLTAAQSVFGILPVAVVVAGGKNTSHTPVVLGLIKVQDDINDVFGVK